VQIAASFAQGIGKAANIVRAVEDAAAVMPHGYRPSSPTAGACRTLLRPFPLPPGRDPRSQPFPLQLPLAPHPSPYGRASRPNPLHELAFIPVVDGGSTQPVGWAKRSVPTRKSSCRQRHVGTARRRAFAHPTSARRAGGGRP
jgi:hypothetical protein